MENTLHVRIKNKSGSSSYWSSQIDFIPLKGELIIYDDHKTYTDQNNQVHNLPGFKLGNGVTTINNLPFVTKDLEEQIITHIENTKVHIQEGEREEWNEKVKAYVQEEIAIFE